MKTKGGISRMLELHERYPYLEVLRDWSGAFGNAESGDRKTNIGRVEFGGAIAEGAFAGKKPKAGGEQGATDSARMHLAMGYRHVGIPPTLRKERIEPSDSVHPDVNASACPKQSANGTPYFESLTNASTGDHMNISSLQRSLQNNAESSD